MGESEDGGKDDGGPDGEAGAQGPRPNRAERRAARAQGAFDEDAFVALADRFIDLANRQNARVDARNVHMAMLWATARYNAHVARNVLAVDEHEPFVEDMLKAYAEMLRQHLADPNL